MENEVKNTEGASASDAGQEPVKKTEDAQIAEVLEATSKKLEELESENKKLSEERENYKTGMLSAKQKIKDLKDQGYSIEDDQPQMNEDSIVAKVVEQLKPLIKPEVKEADDLRLKVSELATALKNRSQINNAGSGISSEEVNGPKKEYFTPEQLEDLKSRGLDPKKVEENMRKQKEAKV